MFFSRRCSFCRARIEKGRGVEEDVEVYGLVGKHKRHFCSEKCLSDYKKATKKLMATRRPNVCMKCLR